MNNQNNPLLNSSIKNHEIDFTQLNAKYFEQALQLLITKTKKEHEWIATECPINYESLFESKKEAEQLSAVFHYLSLLNSTMQTPEIKDIYERYVPEVSNVFQQMRLDERVYYKVLAFENSPDYEKLDKLHQKMVSDVVLSFELNGVSLPDEEKERLTKVNEKLASLQTQFVNNITETEAGLVQNFNLEQLKGLPPRALKNLTKTENGTYEVSYDSGLYDDIMTYADSSETRKAIYEDMLKVGVKEGNDNRPILKEITKLKHDYANILNFETTAHLSLVHNMVKEPEYVLEFIEDLALKSYPQAKKEAQEVQDYGANLLGKKPDFWDRGYIVEKMKKDLYNLDSEQVRQYFPVKNVVGGLFEIVENLYDIHFSRIQKSTWHPDVLVYELTDNQTKEKIGTLYMDLYKRKFKSSGAWMDSAVTRHMTAKEKRLPVAYVVCNMAKDVGQEPTMDFGEIVTLFHEVGHALHHLLTKVDLRYFSGLNNVEHDAVELPSMFMENFAWDYEVLKKLSSHIETGKMLPRNIYENMISSKYFLAASSMLSQALYSQLDMKIFSDIHSNPMQLQKELYERWKTRDIDERAGILPQFSHIFAGGYTAGYYAYKWAEMLSTDSFAALQESGSNYMEQREVAAKFRKHILEVGGSQSMVDNFFEFRGRDPDIQYLLKDYGIKVDKKEKHTL